MASTKDIFYRGLCYDFTILTNLKDELKEVQEALNYAGKHTKYYAKLLNKLAQVKEDIYYAEKTMKNDIKYFGYTQEDITGKYKPKYLNEKQLQADYENDIAEQKREQKKYNLDFKKLLEKSMQLQEQLTAVAC